MNPRILLLAFFLEAFAAACAAYSDISLTVTVAIDEQGRASVSERSLISLDSAEEVGEFNHWIASGKGSIVEWKRFSPNVRYHIGGALSPLNPRITAKRDFTAGYSIGVIILEYELDSVVELQRSGGRTTRHALKQGILGFEGAGGEVVLGKDTALALALPGDAFVARFSPEPNKREGNTFTWQGPITSKWTLEYEREKPLSDEVNEFFAGLANGVAALPWQPALALALLASGALALYWLVKRS